MLSWFMSKKEYLLLLFSIISLPSKTGLALIAPLGGLVNQPKSLLWFNSFIAFDETLQLVVLIILLGSWNLGMYSENTKLEREVIRIVAKIE